jgi:hypothetical protein
MLGLAVSAAQEPRPALAVQAQADDGSCINVQKLLGLNNKNAELGHEIFTARHVDGKLYVDAFNKANNTAYEGVGLIVVFSALDDEHVIVGVMTEDGSACHPTAMAPDALSSL